MADETVDTFNKFMVGTRGGTDVVVMAPPIATETITRKDALILAAWLVANTGQEERFKVVLEAVLAT